VKIKFATPPSSYGRSRVSVPKRMVEFLEKAPTGTVYTTYEVAVASGRAATSGIIGRAAVDQGWCVKADNKLWWGNKETVAWMRKNMKKLVSRIEKGEK
jgi:hypothetical protein